jgi:hypothetical protein
MFIRHSALAAVALAGLAVVEPACAGSFASASVASFNFQLFDLNATDGIVPSVTFSGGGGQYSTVQASATDPSSGSQSNSAWSLVAFGPATVNSAVGLGSAQASVAGSLDAGGLALRASGAALGSTLTFAPTQFNASAALANYGALSFNLTPFTLISFSGQANLAVQTTLGGPEGGGFPGESAQANASISVTGPSAPGGAGFQNSIDTRSLFASYSTVFDPATGQIVYAGQAQTLVNEPLSASFTNYTNGGLSGQLTLNVGVSGFSPLTAVPEPSCAALLLVGLAGLGWRARRPG